MTRFNLVGFQVLCVESVSHTFIWTQNWLLV